MNGRLTDAVTNVTHKAHCLVGIIAFLKRLVPFARNVVLKSPISPRRLTEQKTRRGNRNVVNALKDTRETEPEITKHVPRAAPKSAVVLAVRTRAALPNRAASYRKPRFTRKAPNSRGSISDCGGGLAPTAI